MWSAFLGGVSARGRPGPPTSGLGMMVGGAAYRVCPAERRDFASENESLGRRWYAVASETRVASEMKAPWIVKGGNKIKGEK